MILTHPHAVLPHNHVVSVNLIPLITLMITVIINVVTLAAALTVAHPVVIGITMTEAVVIPLILAMTPLSGIMISSPPEALFDCKIGKYRHDDGTIVAHGCRLSKYPSDFATEDPVSPSHGHSELSIPLEDANHSA